MYQIRLGDVDVNAEGKLHIFQDPHMEDPFVTISDDSGIVFFAPFDKITFIKKS